MTIREKIEKTLRGHFLSEELVQDATDIITTIFKEEIDQKFRKHRLPTNCSWAMAIKEQIQFDEEYGLYWDFTGTEKDGTSFTKEDLLALINSLEDTNEKK